MFYDPISIREAIENVNVKWFLPAIQRPYVWGERSKKEDFIYKLFDSIIREYPIGTLIIWDTDQLIPYRPFLTNFDSEIICKVVDSGQWGRKDKQLIYDGQQRLQSLYSCLKYTFQDKVLCYNLLFDPLINKKPEGFKFFPKHKEIDLGYIKLNEIYLSKSKQPSEFEDIIIEKIKKIKTDLSKEEEYKIKNNIKQLFKIFVDDDTKILSYYRLKKGMNKNEVLDIFNRINTTGVPLSRSDILFSYLNDIKFDFEEEIWEVNHSIKEQTGGFSLGPDTILQTLNVIVKGTIRIDPERTNNIELNKFIDVWPLLKTPLSSFCSDFLYDGFRINHEEIIPHKNLLIPIITYFYYLKKDQNKKYRDVSIQSIKNMKKYFIFSQLLSWDLQRHIENFVGYVEAACKDNQNSDFPYDMIENRVKELAQRSSELALIHFFSNQWFSLKIMMPERQLNWVEGIKGNFSPEIDHIFPQSYSYPSMPPIYDIGNLQPVKGEINNYKLMSLPKDFFIKYPNYLKSYDFLPTTNLNDKVWLVESAKEFIEKRREIMVHFLEDTYDLSIND